MRFLVVPKIFETFLSFSSLAFAGLSLSLAAVPAASAAPSPTNSLTQILERSCADRDVPCVEGYKVRFRDISFETNKRQATLFATLLPNVSIDYPIITERFEGQVMQSTFAVVCKLRDVDGRQGVWEGEAGSEMIKPQFKAALSSCLTALADRTEAALGHSN